MRSSRTVLAAVAASACLSAWGCAVSPLDQDLDPARVGSRAVEFYLPPLSPLGQVVSALLEEGQADVLEVTLPTLQGSLGGPLEFVTGECSIEIPVSDLGAEVAGGRIHITASLLQTETTVPVDVYTGGELMRTCFLLLTVPQRDLHLFLGFGEAPPGGLALVVEGEPNLVGMPAVAQLDAECPQQPGNQVEPVVTGSIEAVVSEAVLVFAAGLAELTGGALGTSSGAAGRVPGQMAFQLRPDPDAAGMGEGDMQLGFSGGFESTRASCVPADAVDPPPSSEPPAEFPPLVPETGATYGMGVSVSKGFLSQGLAAAYRGGLLCRSAGAGDLAGVQLDDLFESLPALGPVQAVRAAVWPGGQPEMEFSASDPGVPGALPGIIVTLPRLSLDLYGNLEWTDVRLLSVTADVLVVLSPRLQNGSLSFGLAEAHIGSLDIHFAKLLAEDGDSLRSGALLAVERVLARLVEDMSLPELLRPACGGGDLVGSALEGSRIQLYFAP